MHSWYVRRFEYDAGLADVTTVSVLHPVPCMFGLVEVLCFVVDEKCAEITANDVRVGTTVGTLEFAARLRASA